jgi:hypothetical protein
MTSLETLRTDWSEHEQVPFPPMPGGRTIDGENVTIVMTEIGGAIVSCLNMNGVLGTRQRSTLSAGLEKLDRILPHLSRPEAVTYFTELKRIGAAVLLVCREV